MAPRFPARAAIRPLALLLLLVPARALAQADASAHPTLPPPRAIPGVTVEDRFPGGCVDCHIVYPEQGLDVRFSSLLAQWSESVGPRLLAQATASSRAGVALVGRHPETKPEALADIPRSCIGCHGRREDEAPDLARLTHLVHLGGGAESVFLTVYQGECTHCHKLDAEQGTWRVPSGAETSAVTPSGASSTVPASRPSTGGTPG